MIRLTTSADGTQHVWVMPQRILRVFAAKPIPLYTNAEWDSTQSPDMRWNQAPGLLETGLDVIPGAGRSLIYLDNGHPPVCLVLYALETPEEIAAMVHACTRYVQVGA